MLIFRYASTGQLSCATVFNELAASVDVVKEGVHAAADFFEAKVSVSSFFPFFKNLLIYFKILVLFYFPFLLLN